MYAGRQTALLDLTLSIVETRSNTQDLWVARYLIYFLCIALCLGTSSAVFLLDFINPCYKASRGRDLSEKTGTVICKIIGNCVLFSVCMCVCLPVCLFV